jgi:Flp pilus assembly pilin Flp
MDSIQLIFVSLLSRVTGDLGDSEDGQTIIEYGLIIALISIVAILTLTTVGGNVKDVFSSTGSKLHS